MHQNSNSQKVYKSGVVLILGKQNVGKSTFVNMIFNEKLSIATPKKGTTKQNIYLVYTNDKIQAQFIDSPGFLQKTNQIPYSSVKKILESIEYSLDVFLFLVEHNDVFSINTISNLKLFLPKNTKKICLITKIDLLKKKNLLLESILNFSRLNFFDEIIPISTIKNQNIDNFFQILEKSLPNSEKMYDENVKYLHDESFFVTEIIREKLLLFLDNEIPHNLKVILISKQQKKDLIVFVINVIVQNQRIRKLIIGKDGQKVKQVGISARKELEKKFNKKIYLDLEIRCKKSKTQ